MPRLDPPTRLDRTAVDTAIAKSVGRKHPKTGRLTIVKHNDGQSLYLLTRDGLGWWQYQWREGAKSRSKLLGSAADMSPAKARQAREELAVERRNGIIPERRGIVNRRANAESAQPGSKLFGEVVGLFLAEFAPGWTGSLDGKEAAAYRRQLTGTDFARLPVAEIQTEHVEAMLKQWSDTPATAEKVLMRVGKILNYATAKKYRSGENPARVRGHFEFLARPVVPTVEHHPAMKSADVPGFMRELVSDGSTEAKALAFLILTSSRSAEVIGAKWKEIAGTVFTCPAERMKGKPKDRRPHSVPLSPQALKLLGKRGAPDDFIFAGRYGASNPIAHDAMREALDRLRGKRLSIEGLPPVPHGFRSTFRDWAAEAGYDRDLAERAIAHKVGNKTETAYQRSKLLEQRRPLMNAWAKFAMSKVQ
jgi:integrase